MLLKTNRKHEKWCLTNSTLTFERTFFRNFKPQIVRKTARQFN